jgi:hypothetical protein
MAYRLFSKTILNCFLVFLRARSTTPLKFFYGRWRGRALSLPSLHKTIKEILCGLVGLDMPYA